MNRREESTAYLTAMRGIEAEAHARMTEAVAAHEPDREAARKVMADESAGMIELRASVAILQAQNDFLAAKLDVAMAALNLISANLDNTNGIIGLLQDYAVVQIRKDEDPWGLFESRYEGDDT